MALVLRGGGSVIWSQSQDNFPYIKGMLAIFLSWVCSPISAGAVDRCVCLAGPHHSAVTAACMLCLTHIHDDCLRSLPSHHANP